MLSTVEIIELEKKLFKYRMKQKINYTIFITLFLLIMGIIGYFFYNQPLKDAPKKEEMIVKIEDNISVPKTEVATLEINISKEESAQKSEVLLPNKNEQLFLQTPTIKRNSNDKKTSTPQVSKENIYTHPLMDEEIESKVLAKRMDRKPEEIFYRNIEDEIQTTMLAPPPLPKEEEKQKSKITIETKEVNSIQYLKEKFEKTHNIIFALMLSEEYYLTKNYNESNKWSLIANSIDPENEKSWIWFAKSKLKLGHKEDAIMALKAFLKNNKSKSIEGLLHQINIGEISD
ncbi:MAG: hypothetical protein J0647_09100 [Campylobacteraceae bacterium]|nr:hypothetical protein [Campylobacteraceae bacterium]